MKRITYLIIYLLIANTCFAQQVPANIKSSYKQIIQLINQGKAAEISKLVIYPLNRPNPLPPLRNANEFIAKFNLIFDNAFKQKLKLYNDTVIMVDNNHTLYGLVGGTFTGEIWLNSKGQITTLNYSSKAETVLKDALTVKNKKSVHPSINSWEWNILIGKSGNLLLRIDYTKKGVRYASWSKGRTMDTKPDLILYGTEEAEGTAGGWTWTFKSGDWNYIVHDWQMCQTADECGYFLNVSNKKKELKPIKLTRIQ